MAFNFGGAGAKPPAFGASTGGGFGAAPAAPAFGAASTSAVPNPFGAPAAGASGAAPSFGGFGASSGAAAGGFGAKPAVPAFGAAPAASGFGAASGAAPAFGAAGAAKPAFGAAPATGAAPAFGAAAGTAPKPAFGATGAGGFGAASGAATGGGFGFGATAAKPATTSGFGAPAATGTGFGAAATGAAGGFGAAGGGFGMAGGTAGAAGGAVPNPFGAPAGAAGAAGAKPDAGAALPLPNQHHAENMQNLVMPIEGVGNFLGSHIVDEIEMENAERKGQPVLSREAAEIFQAVNVQFISWSPWDPAILTSNGRVAASGLLRQAVGGVAIEQKAAQLQRAQPLEVEKQLATLPQDQQDMVKLAMMPRYDQQTLMGSQNNRNPPDVVENQGASCEWKPLVDNPHCRFRHYVLQPLTQAQMKLPPDQRHGFNQTASSSPNDPLFQSKLQENPNPYKYCVLPIVGFHQLMRRVKMQDDKLYEQNAVLQSFEQEVNRMREFQAVEFPKMLAQRKATQVELGRRTLEVLRRLEMQRQPGAAPSREVQMLSDMADQLRQSLSSTHLQRRLQHLEELMAQLRMQDRRRLKQRSVPSVACDMASLERLDEFLEHRLRGVKHLLDLTRKDLRDANIIRHRLAPAASY